MPPTSYTLWGAFEKLSISGFVNTGRPGLSCDNLRYLDTVEVQNGRYLQDDLVQIAASLDSHPMVGSPEDVPGLTQYDIISRHWARLSGSSVFLPEHGVFLCVTRIIYYSTDRRDWPENGWIRGQLFDQDWNHLNNHTISWNGTEFTYPLLYNISTDFEPGGSFYGPEDPRIIMEDVPGAEPVIVFNMISNLTSWNRAMWIYRPFSNHLTVLNKQEDTEWPVVEKNWAPLFVDSTRENTSALLTSQPEPSQYLHFVYSFDSLRILKCHLVTGDCLFVFTQVIPENLVPAHSAVSGSLRGGTNFVPVPIVGHSDSPAVRTYVALPRTNIADTCWDSFYRPALTVLVVVGTKFHVLYASDSLSFGTAVLDTAAAAANPCKNGRVLIANSIPLWDTEDGRDIMTVTFSVDDATVQVARLQGIQRFVHELPRFREYVDWVEHSDAENGKALMEQVGLQFSIAGDDVRACSVEAAVNYSASYTGQYGLAEQAAKKAEEKANEEKERQKAEAEAKWWKGFGGGKREVELQHTQRSFKHE